MPGVFGAGLLYESLKIILESMRESPAANSPRSQRRRDRIAKVRLLSLLGGAVLLAEVGDGAQDLLRRFELGQVAAMGQHG
jgi:hypothetical protein